MLFRSEKPKEQRNYNEVPLSSGIVFVEQDATPAKPAASPPKPWTGRLPIATRKSNAPRCRSTSTLRDGRRHHLGLPQPLLSDRQSPDPPSLGIRRRGSPLESSDEPRTRTERQIRGEAPPEPHHRRRSPPPPKATPAPPLPPQRCRLAHHHAHLGYVHTGIRGFPVLPPPKRPPEGEGSDESPAAS